MSDKKTTGLTAGNGWVDYAKEAQGILSPGQPMQPLAFIEQPRVFDYAVGINIYFNPRESYGLLSYGALRNLALTCDAVRIVIESIKREVRGLTWVIRPKDKADKTNYSSEIARLTEFWNYPDGVDGFDTWMNRLLDDLLVLDAPTLWINSDENGGITAVDVIDGATIRPLLDIRGKTPLPPIPAYIQMIKGIPAQWFTSDRLLFRPYNVTSNTPYGRSPIEWMVIRINEALRRQFSNAEYWNVTNVPEAIVSLPDTWNPDQIKTFQAYWDTIVAGNLAVQRRIRFVPSGSAGNGVHEFRRPDAAGQAGFDEFLIRVACWAYGFSPTELGIVAGNGGLGGKGYMQGGENAQMRLGLAPLIQYIGTLITSIIKKQTDKPLEFEFVEIGPDEDKQKQNVILEKKLKNGVIDVNVWRSLEGQPPLDNVKPFIVIGSQIIMLDDLFAKKESPSLDPFAKPNSNLVGEAAPSENDEGKPEEKLDENDDGEANRILVIAMNSWRKKVARRLSEKKSADCQPPENVKGVLPVLVERSVRGMLANVSNATEANEVFRIMSGVQPTQDRRRAEESLKHALIEVFGGFAKQVNLETENHIRGLAHESDGFWQKFRATLKNALSAHLSRCAHIGIDETKKEGEIKRAYPYIPPFSADVDWTLVNHNAEQWAMDYAGELVKGISETTRKRIAKAIADWIQEGNALDDLRDDIFDIISDPSRAFTIAITESTRAFAKGNTISWKAQGVQGRRWYTAEDEIVCPICGGLSGTVAAMGVSFSGGIDDPPAHVGCRCYLQPIVDIHNQEAE